MSMRFLITLVSIVSLLFIGPFAFAATSTQTATPKPTAEAFTLPGMGMMNDDSGNIMGDMMGNGQNFSSMMGGTNLNPMMRGRMMNFPMYGFDSSAAPWVLFFCTITMILGWALVISIIYALWTWIKKQK